MERRRIIVNFKNNEEDIKLYNSLKKHSCISGYIKDHLRGLVNEEKKKSEKVDLDNILNNL